MNTMWFFVFLTFVIKIGQIWPFQFTDFTSLMASHYSKGLSLPHAPNSHRGPSSRHLVFITIDKQGRFLIDGKLIEPEKLDSLLSEARDAIEQNQIILLDQDSEYFVFLNSLTVFALLIDKNCEMWTVHKLFNTLRKNKFNKVFFIAHKIEREKI